MAGGVSELVNGLLQDVIRANPNLTDQQKSAITQWAAALVGAAIGGGGGAASALDNVNFNFLDHAEALALKEAQDKCYGGDKDACQRAAELNALDEQRDANLREACSTDIAGDACKTAVEDLRAALASLYENNQGLDPVMMHWIELYQRTMEADLNDPSGVKRDMLSALAGALLGGGFAAQRAAVEAEVKSLPGTVIVVDSSGNANVVINGIEMSMHAASQATVRGISIQNIQTAVTAGESFTYMQNGARLTGYYDAASNTFVGVGDRITTVVRPKNPTSYIANVKARQ